MKNFEYWLRRPLGRWIGNRPIGWRVVGDILSADTTTDEHCHQAVDGRFEGASHGFSLLAKRRVEAGIESELRHYSSSFANSLVAVDNSVLVGRTG